MQLYFSTWYAVVDITMPNTTTGAFVGVYSLLLCKLNFLIDFICHIASLKFCVGAVLTA